MRTALDFVAAASNTRVGASAEPRSPETAASLQRRQGRDDHSPRYPDPWRASSSKEGKSGLTLLSPILYLADRSRSAQIAHLMLAERNAIRLPQR